MNFEGCKTTRLFERRVVLRSGMCWCPHKGFVQCSDNGLWQLNGNEIIGREKVVFSAFVNDAHVAVGLRVFVGKHAVNFVQFQRGGVFAVVNTDGKSRSGFCGFHRFSPGNFCA